MTYSLSRSSLGILAVVNADRISRIKQGLQDLRLLPAGTSASTPDAAYALKEWARSQGLPTSYVVWNGTTLQIDNVLADRFAAAVTEARRTPGQVTSSAATASSQYVQSASKTDPADDFVPSSTIPATTSTSPWFDRTFPALANIAPAWVWGVGVVGAGAAAWWFFSKRKSVTLTANKRRLRRNRSDTRTVLFHRTSRSKITRSSKSRRKLGKLRLLVRGRGKKMYVYPRRRRAEVLRGRVTIKPNRRRRRARKIRRNRSRRGISRNGRIDVHYGQDETGKVYVEDWKVKPYDLPYFHHMYSMKSLDHAKRFADSVVKMLHKHGYEARTLRFDQSLAA